MRKLYMCAAAILAVYTLASCEPITHSGPVAPTTQEQNNAPVVNPTPDTDVVIVNPGAE